MTDTHLWHSSTDRALGFLLTLFTHAHGKGREMQVQLLLPLPLLCAEAFSGDGAAPDFATAP